VISTSEEERSEGEKGEGKRRVWWSGEEKGVKGRGKEEEGMVEWRGERGVRGRRERERGGGHGGGRGRVFALKGLLPREGRFG
jgi:hypothetical protein